MAARETSRASRIAARAGSAETPKAGTQTATQTRTDTAQDYVSSLYDQYLGRTPDESGRQYWSDQIASGAMSKADVARAFSTSPEAQLFQTYQRELGRSAKGDTGFNYWNEAVQSGRMSLEDAQRAIARSQEGAMYDVNRIYQSELGRKPDEGGAQYWADELMRGVLTEDQFLNAVRQSEEYKARMAAPPPPPPPAPTPAPAPAPVTPPSTAPALQRYQSQLEQLQKQAIENAAKGYFEPTYPIPQAQAPLGTTAASTTAQAPAQADLSIAPTPAVSVPMTYLSPAPPQYRGIDPFQSPFSTSFQSYFDIANARPPMSYPSPFVAQPAPQPATGTAPAQAMSPYPFPFQYYQGMYSSPQATTSFPAPGTPTTPTT